MEEEYYTVDEVAKRFKVTKAAVYKWMRAGELPYVIIGKDRRVTGTALKAFVKPGRSDEATHEDRLARYTAIAGTMHSVAG